MKKSIIWASLEALITPVLMIFITPYTLKLMGDENYGVWVFFNVISSFFGIFNFGFGDLILKHGAEIRGKGELEELNFHYNSIFSIALSVLLSSLIFSLVLLYFFPIESIILKLPESIVNKKMFYVTIFLISLLRVLESIIISVFKSKENFRVSSLFNVISKSIVIIVQIFIYFKFKSLDLAFVYSMLLLLVIVLIEFYISKLKFVFLDLKNLKKIYYEFKKFGFYSWFLSVNGIFYGHFDKIIIAKYINLKELAFYSIAQTVVQQIHLLFSTAFQVVVPRVSYMIGAKESYKKHVLIYWKWLIVLFIFITLGYFAFDMMFFRLWLGQEKFTYTRNYLYLFYFYELALVLNIIPYYYLIAKKKNDYNAYLSLGMSLCTFGSLYFLQNITSINLIMIRIYWASLFSFLFILFMWKDLKNER